MTLRNQLCAEKSMLKFYEWNNRANTSQDEGDGKIAVQEGDILYVVQKDKELWDVMAVDKRSGKIFMEQKGTIPNPDRFEIQS